MKKHNYTVETFEAGRTEKGAGYSYFVPTLINVEWTWQTPKLHTLLEKASTRLGELNAFARLVPNVDLFIHLHLVKEAVVSSRIEGTRTNMDEALMPEGEIAADRLADWLEVVNYTTALNTAIDELGVLPLSSRLLRQAHHTLLQSVRGSNKQSGEFRRSQNWIGGLTIADAIFIPPAHSYVEELMGDLENFLHNADIDVPDLIRIGIAHYQFETIHPFLDGNGRIGRLMIPLYLVSRGVLHKPLLYPSVFFEQDRNLYYDNLMRVRKQNDLLHWLQYFLVGIEATATKAVSTLEELLALKTALEEQLHGAMGKRSGNALLLLTYLFEQPFNSIKEVSERLSISPKSANELVSKFVALGILEEISGQSRNRLFVFRRYIQLFS